MIDLLRLRGWPEARAHPTDVAFEAVAQAHYRRIYSLVYRIVRDEADAADLTQEVFVRAYRGWSGLRAEGAQAAWLRRIATNLCLDHLRRRRTTPPMSSLDARTSDDSDEAMVWDVPDPTNEPDRVYVADERARVLHRAVASLPADYRQAIILHHIEGLGVDEIARSLGVPAGTVKSRLSRARRELHRKLSPYFDPDLAPVR